jgi:hypothetical protein
MLDKLEAPPTSSIGGSGGSATVSAVVHWPDPVLRFVLLEETHKAAFWDALRLVQVDLTLVRVEIPYRDKQDATAAMRLSGPAHEVLRVQRHVEEILEEYRQQLHQFTLLVNACQLSMLRGADLRLVKSIQRRFGVFVHTSGEKPSTRRAHDLGGVDARLIASGEIIEEDDSVLCEAVIDCPTGQALETTSEACCSPHPSPFSMRGSTMVRVLRRDVSEVHSCAVKAIAVANDLFASSSTGTSAFPAAASALLESFVTREDSAERARLSTGGALAPPKGDMPFCDYLIRVCAPASIGEETVFVRQLRGCIHNALASAQALAVHSVCLLIAQLGGPAQVTLVQEATVHAVLSFFDSQSDSCIRRVDLASTGADAAEMEVLVRRLAMQVRIQACCMALDTMFMSPACAMVLGSIWAQASLHAC